ncbi:MAG: hypothetical protein HS101_18480 [Planctomycetia bacterium]|nr:hypothetical protein [Planctomycetia bacterium]
MNQWSGVVALIAVACLVAFGSAGDRIVTAAPGQIGPAGDTGEAIAIGGCNRCAWSAFPTNGVGTFQVAPIGTGGVFHGMTSNDFIKVYNGPALPENFLLQLGIGDYPRLGFDVRFTNGLTIQVINGSSSPTFLYRLD